VHRLACDEDFEQFWKTTGNLSMVRQAERRCKNFVLKLDPEGGAEWVVRHWEQQWRTDRNVPSRDLHERLLTAAFLEGLGLHHTFLLCDKSAPAAGATVLVHGRCVVASVMFRLPEYDYYGTGTFLIASIFRWAAQSGYLELDIGGDHEYKKLWAPVGGFKYEFTVSPMRLYLPHVVATKAGAIFSRPR